MIAGEAVIVLRDHGPGVGEQRYEALLAVAREVVESGPNPWTALRRLVTANPEAVDWALLLGNRPADGMTTVGGADAALSARAGGGAIAGTWQTSTARGRAER